MICGPLIYDTIIGAKEREEREEGAETHTKGSVDSESSTKRFPIGIR